jgi:hypothetical protein
VWTHEQQAGDYLVRLQGSASGGRPYVTSVTITGRTSPDVPDEAPVTARQYEVVRETLMAVGRAFNELAEHAYALHRATERIEAGPGKVTIRTSGAEVSVPVARATLKRTDPAAYGAALEQAATARRRRLTDDDLTRVAETYQTAQHDKQPVIAAVAQEMHVSRSRAAHLIKEARRAGILPPAQPRGNRNAEDE